MAFTNEMRIEDNQEPLTIEIKYFHTSFYLAYCITSHASQSDTFKNHIQFMIDLS